MTPTADEPGKNVQRRHGVPAPERYRRRDGRHSPREAAERVRSLPQTYAAARGLPTRARQLGTYQLEGIDVTNSGLIITPTGPVAGARSMAIVHTAIVNSEPSG